MEHILVEDGWKNSGHFTGDITKEIDQFIIRAKGSEDLYYTYIMSPSRSDNGYLCMRVPGATRGHIKINNDMIIEEIKFYDRTCFEVFKCYEKEVVEFAKKFIGDKLVFLK